MKTTRVIARMICLSALLLLAATLFAFQTLTQVSGPPFSADYYEISHKRGNAPDEASRGRRVVQGRFWRDGHGRVRQETWEVDAQGNRSNQQTFITDPTQNLDYRLESDKKAALRSKLFPDRANTHANPPTDPAPSARAQPVKRHLGSETVEGFSCERYETCYLSRCEETWWCPELQYVAKIRRTYDSGAVDEMVWSNFKVGAEPDPQLFVVPSDYTIVDRKGLK